MLIETIREIINEKRAAKKVPCHALGIEVSKRMNMTKEQITPLIDQLVQFGLIRSGDTLNDKYYELNEELG